MNELKQGRSRVHASIVTSPLASHKTANNMNELTQERSHIHASIVKSPLATHQIASDMSELTQERGCIHASIVKIPLVSRQNVGNMKRDMQEPAPSNMSNMIIAFNSRRDPQEPVATLDGKKSCILPSLPEENSSQVESLTCWICLEEFSSEACVIEHYDEHMTIK